jgi:hypothetical protein
MSGLTDLESGVRNKGNPYAVAEENSKSVLGGIA